MRAHCFVAAVLLGVCAVATQWSARAHAEPPPCPQSNHPMVELLADAEPQDSVLTGKITRHLSAALQAREIPVCASSGAPGAGLGGIHVLVTGSGRSLAIIEIADRVTQKKVERTLDLTDLPADGWPLAIASSADELLRASWAELALRDAPALPEPPAIVKRVTEQSLRLPEPVRKNELALEASAAAWKRLDAFGGRIRVARWLSSRWALMAATEALFGLSRSGPHGSIGTSTLALEAGADYAFASFDAPQGLALEGAVAVQRISFAAHANPNGESHSFSDWSALLHARVRGWLDLGPVRASLSLGAAYGLRASRAFDAGKVISGNQGFSGELLVGCGTRF